MHSKLHVVFICSEFPLKNRPTGGFGTYVDAISLSLVKLKINVSIICQGETSTKFLSHGRKIIIITSPGFLFLRGLSNKSQNFINRLINFFNYPVGFSLNAAVTILRLSHQEKIDLIEGGDFGAEMLFTVLFKSLHFINIPVVIKLHTPSFLIRRFNLEPQTWFYRVMEKLEVFCLQKVDALYSPTVALQTLIENEYDVLVSRVIPYPFQEKSVSRRQKRDRRLILYVGKIQSKKGVRDLVRAIPQISKKRRGLKFTFIGPDTFRSGVSEKNILLFQAEQAGFRQSINFIAALPQYKLTEFYQKAAVIIVPSHWENFPNVILEAGRIGTPVVATCVGGIPEMIIHKKTGLLVAPQSPRQLANTILFLLRRPVFAKNLGRELKQHLQKTFSAHEVANLTYAFYVDLLQSTRKARAVQSVVPKVISVLKP